MSSIGTSVSRTIRDYGGGETIVNVPDQLVAHLDLTDGDEIAFDDDHQHIYLYPDPDEAPVIAPTRKLRRNNGEFTLNLPADVVEAHELDNSKTIDYRQPSDGRIPVTVQENHA